MRGTRHADGIEFKDRAFSVAELRLVQEIVADHGRLSRQELANTVGELLDWRRFHGGLKTWEAKELLAVLDERGLLRLPALRTTKPRGARTSIPRTGLEPGAPLVAQLGEVTPNTVRRVSGRDDRRLWRELVERYHPRGHRVPFGAHLRWLVEVARPCARVVACIQLSSPAWQLAARDRWIGWNDRTRRQRLQQIVNHSRFLVLPWVAVPHLASHLLGHLARLAPLTWHEAYGVRPVLLETLVEVGRPGTCYRAANWIALAPPPAAAAWIPITSVRAWRPSRFSSTPWSVTPARFCAASAKGPHHRCPLGRDPAAQRWRGRIAGWSTRISGSERRTLALRTCSSRRAGPASGRPLPSPRAPRPRRPGRRPGAAHGRTAQRGVPKHIDEVVPVPLPPRCPHCGAAGVVPLHIAPQYRNTRPSCRLCARASPASTSPSAGAATAAGASKGGIWWFRPIVNTDSERS